MPFEYCDMCWRVDVLDKHFAQAFERHRLHETVWLDAVARNKSQLMDNAMAGQWQRYRWQAAVLVRCMQARWTTVSVWRGSTACTVRP